MEKVIAATGGVVPTIGDFVSRAGEVVPMTVHFVNNLFPSLEQRRNLQS